MVDSQTKLVYRGRTDHLLDPGAGSSGTPLFAGHVPWTNFWGMNASTSSRPQEAEAKTIIGGDIYVNRYFSSSEVTTTWLNNKLAATDAAGEYGVLSCKINGEAWDQVVAGNKDSVLNVIRDVAITRRSQGKPAFAFTFHHEPDGDGPIGNPASSNADRLANLELWAQMQMYCSDYLAGIKGGSYNAANDVSDMVAWCAIANGHWWGSKFPKPDRIAAAYPAELYTKFETNKSILMADFYDAAPPNGDRDNPGGYPADADRTSVKIDGFINWGDSYGGTVAMGCGEFGTTQDTEMQAVFDLVMSRRDVWAITLYFNNFANSIWDWRLILDSYPAYNGTNSKGLLDEGGSAMTELQLIKFRALRDLSITTPYTTEP